MDNKHSYYWVISLWGETISAIGKWPKLGRPFYVILNLAVISYPALCANADSWIKPTSLLQFKGRRYSHGERRYKKHVVDYSPLVIRPSFYMTRFLYTIACLTGYPQDMCVATATHGPQACTLSLCVRSLPP